jgi:L-2-hydroxyglutarate oxidase LhgO
MDRVEIVVIGAGVVGLAIAQALASAGREVLVLEQHDLIGSETSSRNSEVIHAGIYYPAQSIKAELCVEGKLKLYDFCSEFHVPYRRCGKIIVATSDQQLATIEGYVAQAKANGVDDLSWLDKTELFDYEPEVRAVAGVLSPSTGIIDSHAYMLALQGVLEANGGTVVLNTPVSHCQSTDQGVVVASEEFEICADWLINCGGLGAPKIATQLGMVAQSFYAKGHYYAYGGPSPFSRLVYPVAEGGGLGVHVTLDIAGQVKFGPDVRWVDRLDYTFDESHFDEFVTAIQHYYPAVDASRLHPSYTGIRPKLAPSGAGFQDFVIAGPTDHGVNGCVHLLGIESPGLTASLAIAERVCRRLYV